MATTAQIDATVGGSASNSYATLAEADQYHQNKPDPSTTWRSSQQRKEALLWATKLLDSLIVWNGWVVTDTQNLLWPRNGLKYRNGYDVPTTVIPQELKDACSEYALQLLSGDRVADDAVETKGIKKLKAGPVELEFKDSVTAKTIPDAVFFLLPEEWGLVRERSSGTRPLVRA